MPYLSLVLRGSTYFRLYMLKCNSSYIFQIKGKFKLKKKKTREKPKIWKN